ncbi:hypothetical protein D9M68_985210 [compost metagenome]
MVQAIEHAFHHGAALVADVGVGAAGSIMGALVEAQGIAFQAPGQGIAERQATAAHARRVHVRAVGEVEGHQSDFLRIQ